MLNRRSLKSGIIVGVVVIAFASFVFLIYRPINDAEVEKNVRERVAQALQMPSLVNAPGD